MRRVLSVAAQRFPIAGTFTISRGSKTEAEVIACAISQDSRMGRGECVPYRHYGETMESVAAAIDSVRSAVEVGCDRDALLTLLPAGAARNALDCALWDLEAKQSGQSVASRICKKAPAPIVTAAMAVPAITNQKPPHAHFTPTSGFFRVSSVMAYPKPIAMSVGSTYAITVPCAVTDL